jgi:uncharacterized protein Yka (UPF0111/DUF47 family)
MPGTLALRFTHGSKSLNYEAGIMDNDRFSQQQIEQIEKLFSSQLGYIREDMKEMRGSIQGVAKETHDAIRFFDHKYGTLVEIVDKCTLQTESAIKETEDAKREILDSSKHVSELVGTCREDEAARVTAVVAAVIKKDRFPRILQTSISLAFVLATILTAFISITMKEDKIAAINENILTIEKRVDHNTTTLEYFKGGKQ